MTEAALQRITISLLLLLSSTSAAIAASGIETPRPVYRLVKKVKLGGQGSWDYFEVDSRTHRVYIPRTSHLMIVDPEGKLVGDIPNLPGAHAVALAPELGLGFTANDSGHSVTTFDLKSLQVVRETKIAGRTPDGILYEPVSQRVFSFNGGSGNDATAIDAQSGKIVGTVPLGGKPESTQSDAQGRVYVTLQDKDKLAVFDAKALKIEEVWPVAPCMEPVGLALDEQRHHLFLSCRTRQVMTMMSSVDGKVLDSIPIGWLVDASRFDPKTGLIFSSCYDGTLTVAEESPSDKLVLKQTVATQMGARTMALDTETHDVFVITADLAQEPKPTTANPHPRPAVLPGTFTLLRYGLQDSTTAK